MTKITASNTYIIDPDSPAEMAHLMTQNRLMTRAMGGPLSDLPTLANRARVLDLACGPGGWALDLAFEHPDFAVVGVDMSEAMVRFARTQAQVQKLPNVTFEIMDIMKPLELPDASFDMVHLGLLSTFMMKDAWPSLMIECLRVLRPGGGVRITDIERAYSNSLAHERCSTLFVEHLYKMGRSFSPDGQHIGILPMLTFFLEQAGFESISMKLFGVDYSFGKEAHDTWCPILLESFRLAVPILASWREGSQAELERIHERAVIEMAMPEFRALLTAMTAWGTKKDRT